MSQRSRKADLCGKCAADCCRTLNVFLTDADTRRIHKFLKLDPLEFTSPFPASALPSRGMFSEFELDVETLLVLDKKLGKQECVFLLTIGNSRRCGIHAFKPMVCRTYPFTLDSRGRLETMEPFLCPRHWWPEKKERDRVINDVTILRKELEEYKILVDAWNKQHSHEGDFPKYIAFVLNWKPSRNETLEPLTPIANIKR